ncbi:MAG: hypothetical protein ACK50C_08085 [Gemmatimonadaceae bacterium]
MTPRGGVGPIAAQRARNAALRDQADALAAPHQPAARPLPVIVLPANTRETTPLPDETREQFLRHLRLQITRAFAAPLRDNTAPMSEEDEAMRADAGEIEGPSADSDALAVGAVLGAACATCRGECCTAGGTHAFLKAASLVRVRANLATSDGGSPSADAIEAHYAAALPARHYRGSCVFHATGGCTLARGLRSNLCNRYLCGALTQLTRAMAATGEASAFVAAADSVHLRRMALLSPEGARAIARP